jgi:hypothetical protein
MLITSNSVYEINYSSIRIPLWIHHHSLGIKLIQLCTVRESTWIWGLLPAVSEMAYLSGWYTNDHTAWFCWSSTVCHLQIFSPLLPNQTFSLPLAEQSKKLKPGEVIFWQKDQLVLRKVTSKYKTLSPVLKKMFSNSLKFPPPKVIITDDISGCHKKNIKKEWRFVWNLLHAKGCYMASLLKGI